MESGLASVRGCEARKATHVVGMFWDETMVAVAHGCDKPNPHSTAHLEKGKLTQ